MRFSPVPFDILTNGLDAMPRDLVELVEANKFDIVQHDLKLDYDHWTGGALPHLAVALHRLESS